MFKYQRYLMFIQKISVSNYPMSYGFYRNCSDKKNTQHGKYLCSDKNYLKPVHDTVSFSGKPWNIPYVDVKNSYDAMVLFDFLKTGNYLDSADDDVSEANKIIRKNNLGFLDALESEKDKEEFIKYYEYVTGFPDLKKVSENIEREFIKSIKKSSLGVSECIAAGYDRTCSVGKRCAFPGSDLDKAYIILKGSDYSYEDNKIVEQFKANLWNNTDQRILSFNHDISFPSIYTVNQIKTMLRTIDNFANNVDLDREYLKELMDEEFIDLEKASQYNLAVSEYFDTDKNMFGPTKTEVKNFGYFIESVREGKPVISTPEFKRLIDEIKDSDFYNYSNVGQIRAMKKAIDEGRENKTKILLREKLPEKYNNWDTDKKYKFICNLIKYSCEDNEDFIEYFKNDRNVKDAYKPLLNRLTRGNPDYYNRPEFSVIENGLKMQYSKDKSVNLYQGYNKNILWVDTNNAQAINEVLRQMEKIKQCDLFRDVTKIQCPKPNASINGVYFYPIKYAFKNNKNIYEGII